MSERFAQVTNRRGGIIVSSIWLEEMNLFALRYVYILSSFSSLFIYLHIRSCVSVFPFRLPCYFLYSFYMYLLSKALPVCCSVAQRLICVELQGGSRKLNMYICAFEVCHPRCVGSVTKNYCVLHIQSNTTIFHPAVLSCPLGHGVDLPPS